MTRTSFDNIGDEARAACTEQGATCLHGTFIDRVELLRAGERPGKNRLPVLWPRAHSQGQ